MTPEKRKEISRSGGKAAHQQGVGHEWTSAEARNAGKKGGDVTAKKRRQQQEREERK